ncbi:hypothetical protein RN001_015003 [Aquatica leii]|uniref:gamma-glutamylcyclotransferase n=1 Tax=Aquatica leii TaxID=1421715 RepID=A0AAN7PP33_9COLE|nr:hypothetical protein RN001_015003 [Aquatica leii]
MLSTLVFVLFVVPLALSSETVSVRPRSSSSFPIYFGYGSNLLKERLERSVKATRMGIGKIKDYRLDFDYFSKRWNGSVATIVPDSEREVWVAIWRIPKGGFKKIDKQEGVAENVYKRFKVNVEMPDGNTINGYTYMLTKNPDRYIPLNQLPNARQPSKSYMDVIVKGAEESGLPTFYQDMLKSVSHNDYDGQVHYELS